MVTGTEDVADVVDMGVAEGADVVVAGTPVLDERAEVWARSVFADVAAGVATVVGDVAGVEVLDAEVVEVDAAAVSRPGPWTRSPSWRPQPESPEQWEPGSS